MTIEAKSAGTFYGVGVGPGDPELLTLKAVRVIQHCELIVYLRSELGHSETRTMARNIAATILSASTHRQKEYPIMMPMFEARERANAIYDEAARVIADYLECGQDVAFLCQGDPFFFGSFAYLYARLQHRHTVEIVPGITSINAAAALCGKPLGLLAENIAIISGRRTDEDILHTLNHFDNVAIMKPGKRRPALLRLIAQAQRTDDACYIEYAGQEKQKIVHDITRLDSQPAPYFALFLLNRTRDDGPPKSTPNQIAAIQCPVPVDIFSLTERGNTLATRLQRLLPEASHYHRASPFVATAQSSFRNGHRCIFICATGIVIRALAPVLGDKHHDPAVIVIDESGRDVIPLLSAHEGGATAFAHDIAEAISAHCVVTSTSDYSHPIYTIGMGCERGCPADVLQQLLHQVTSRVSGHISGLNQIPPYAALASIDLKADEVGLIELSNHLGIELQTFSALELRQVEHLLSEKSDLVFKQVGCHGVAEAAALCCARKLTGKPAELVMTKQKNAHATIAIARSYRAQFDP